MEEVSAVSAYSARKLHIYIKKVQLFAHCLVENLLNWYHLGKLDMVYITKNIWNGNRKTIGHKTFNKMQNRKLLPVFDVIVTRVEMKQSWLPLFYFTRFVVKMFVTSGKQIGDKYQLLFDLLFMNFLFWKILIKKSSSFSSVRHAVDLWQKETTEEWFSR